MKDQTVDIFHPVLRDYCMCSVTFLQGLQAWEIGLNCAKRNSDKLNVELANDNSKG